LSENGFARVFSGRAPREVRAFGFKQEPTDEQRRVLG
jgi:hypothetical protein